MFNKMPVFYSQQKDYYFVLLMETTLPLPCNTKPTSSHKHVILCSWSSATSHTWGAQGTKGALYHLQLTRAEHLYNLIKVYSVRWYILQHPLQAPTECVIVQADLGLLSPQIPAHEGPFLALQIKYFTKMHQNCLHKRLAPVLYDTAQLYKLRKRTF